MHRLSRSVEYMAWNNMVQRCTNINHPSYKNYGGRGIVVCDEWLSFENFYKDMGKKVHASFTLERINNNAGYAQKNCCWADRVSQNRNQRIRKTNKLGVKGVYRNRRNLLKKYRVRIQVGSNHIHLGYYATLKEAIKSRKQGELLYWRKGGV